MIKLLFKVFQYYITLVFCLLFKRMLHASTSFPCAFPKVRVHVDVSSSCREFSFFALVMSPVFQSLFCHLVGQFNI